MKRLIRKNNARRFTVASATFIGVIIAIVISLTLTTLMASLALNGSIREDKVEISIFFAR